MCGRACACQCHYLPGTADGSLPGGSPGSECEDFFLCVDCEKTFTQKKNLLAHKKYYCVKAKGLDHLVASSRKDLAEPTDKDIEQQERKSTSYRVDQDMAQFLETVPSVYAKFMMCENPRNPQPLPGFWPVLFDYRGKQTLEVVENYIGVQNAYKTLADILTDAHIFHNVKSITVKKKAFVELPNGDTYEITDYRTPHTHCKINPNAQVRLDQPRFDVTETDTEVTIALHEKYLELLPSSYLLSTPAEDEADNMETNEEEDMEVEGIEDWIDGADEDWGMQRMFELEDADEDWGLQSIFEPDDAEEMSQELSQISLDDAQELSSNPISKRKTFTDSSQLDNQVDGPFGHSLAASAIFASESPAIAEQGTLENSSSPVSKRKKTTDSSQLENQVDGTFGRSLVASARFVSESPAKAEQEFSCQWCKLYVGGNIRDVNKHIQKSCPDNPNIDALEAARRKRRAESKQKKEVKPEVKPEVEPEVKPEPKKEEEQEDQPRQNPDSKGDCGCSGGDHQQGCPSQSTPIIIHAHAHRRLPRNQPGPHLNPDPDTLNPRLLGQIIPVIQAVNRQRFTNRQNRWIAGLGQPRNPVHMRNTLWHRVVSKYQLPFLLSENDFQDLFYFTPQQVFQFRNSIIYPMLNERAAQAQGPRGARSSLPHTLTADSLACLFFAKVRLNMKDRVIAACLGIHHKHVEKWLKAVRDYYFTHDPFIQRNVNLSVRANLQALLRQGIDATANCPRTSAQYGHLCRPHTELLVVAIDSRAVKIQQSTDAHLQKRTISTKIHDNAVQKMTVSDISGQPMITFPLMCSISPAGTDESNCENLITIHEHGLGGGLFAFMESPLTEPVTLVLLEDQGFRKFGFDHANRRSFIDYQDDLQRRSNGGFRYFTPCFPSDPYRDQNFNAVGHYGQLPGGSRHRSKTANTSAACCTKSRWPVEALFCKESHLSLLGSSSEVPNQYLGPCGIANYDSQSRLAVWLHIGDSLLFHHATPYTYKYGTVDSYRDHGNDIRHRIELETPLSSLSGVQWSRDNIFLAPLGHNPVTRQGQPITQVNLFDQQQTGMPPVTLDELSSVTLGSYQPKLVRTYLTSLR